MNIIVSFSFNSYLFSVFYIVFFITPSYEYPMFLSYIPNGNSVPDPCPGSNKIFLAVGHWHMLPHQAKISGNKLFGVFERNPFGEVRTFESFNLLSLL